MSGICGWSNNKASFANTSPVLQQMADKLMINQRHALLTAPLECCALAAVGPSGKIGINSQNGLHATIHGSFRWLDSDLTRVGKEQGHGQALIHAYQRHGTDFLQSISGSFALCIVDETNRRTLIAIDRLGISSLFYSLRDGRLIFSSNAKALSSHPDVGAEINPQSVYDYFYFHMVPSPGCIFKSAEKLLPGQFLLFEDGKSSTGFYWQAKYNELSSSSVSDLETQFMDILTASVKRAAEDSKTGTFLSGGTDSSTVAGIFRKQAGFPVSTYSIGFNADGFDETYYAKLASRHFGTTPHEYFLTPQDVVAAIPEIANAYDEPFGNASAVPAYFCAKLAHADGLDTLLAGDGGDELFAGNARYAKQKVFELYHQLPGALRRFVIEPAIFNFPLGGSLAPVAKARSYIRQANIPLPDRLEAYNFLHRMALAEIFDPGFLATVDTNAPTSYLRETYARAKAQSALNRMLFLDLKFTLADNDLRKVNRMCELGQMEVRYPLLDEELLRFSADLPASLKLRGYKLRYFFKHALRDFLPKEILSKSKHGFGLPFGVWLDSYEPLREIACQSLASLSTRGIVNPGFVKEIQRLHSEHPSYYGTMIWVMMIFEQWLQNASQPQSTSLG